jgi:DHA3 family macrolide efflux protein-like MFS transporter
VINKIRAMAARLLVNRQLGLLWIGQVVSQTGDSVYQIGLLWLMLEMTGSKSLTGVAAASLFLPTLLFGLPAGVFVDRVSRRRLMIGADALRAGLVLTIPLAYAAGVLTPLFLGAVTFAVASCAAVFNPARDAFVPRLATSGDLPHANALIQTSWQLAILLGPAVAAIMLSVVGIIHLFSFDATTFLISLVAIVAIGRTVPLRGRAIGMPVHSVFHQLREGLSYVGKDPVMRMLIFVTAIDNLILMGPAIVGTPILVREGLGLEDPRAYAWLQASLAGGMVVGAPFMATVGRRLPMGKTVMAGIILDGLTFAPFFFVRTLPAAVLVLFVHSFFIPLITVSRTTLVQRYVPTELHGRMFSVIGVCVVGGTAISSAITGLAAEYLPIQKIYLLAGLGAATTALPGFFSKALRRAT